MTRSKFRRAIRDQISARLDELNCDAMRSLVVSITDVIVDYLDEYSAMEDTDACFDDVIAVLKEAKLEPETIGNEILKNESENS